ncbi:MAG: cell division protein FtsQ/DivIB [Moraxella sp.]|nr:cell division protein FtsQ/DivIB [Moraxella sp.]
MTQRDANKNTMSSWHTTVWLVVVLLGVMAAFVYIMSLRPAQKITVAASALNPAEYTALQNAMNQLGEVSFYRTDLSQIGHQALTLSWVDNVRVERNWQQGIVVHATSKTAVANFGSERLVDAHGAVFSPADAASLGDTKLTTLYGEGEDASQIMQKMYRLNQWYAPVGLVVEDIVLMPRRTWLIRFDNGLRVVVDHDRSDEKLYMLSGVLADKNSGIEMSKIESVDLRYKNGFSIAWKTM